MSPGIVARDVVEGLILLVLLAMIVIAAVRISKGRIRPNICQTCDRPFSRVYQHCPHCGAE